MEEPSKIKFKSQATAESLSKSYDIWMKQKNSPICREQFKQGQHTLLKSKSVHGFKHKTQNTR